MHPLTDKSSPPLAIHKLRHAGAAARNQGVVIEGSGAIHVQRCKGRREMIPEHLWKTTMGNDVCTRLQVTMEDAVEADGVFTKLMGGEVEPRRQFIEQNARYVRNLDV